MKKRFFIIGLSVLCAITLISCKGNKNDTPPVTSSSESTLDSDKKSDSQKKSDDVKEEDSNKKNDTQKTQEENEKSSVKNIKCRIYLFNTSELKHYYIDKELPVEDHAIITALTKELQNTSYNEKFLVLPDSVKIKSANVDKETGVLKIVFSDSYVDKMTLGTATEGGLLTSLLATYGYNLGVDKVAIYFNDELYTCLRGELPEGYYTVKLPEAKQYTP